MPDENNKPIDEKYPFNKQKIMSETGVSYNLWKRCNAEILLLGRFREKKAQNEIWYNPNGLIIWREIKKMDENGKTMRQIIKELESIHGNQETGKKTPVETSGNESGNEKPINRGRELSDTQMLIEALKEQAVISSEGWKKAAEASEREALNAQKLIAEFEKKQLALPEGKTPDQIKAELEEKENLSSQVNELQKVVTDKEEEERDKALKRETLLQEHEDLKKAIADKDEAEKVKNTKREALLKEIEELGWFKSKEKKRLIQELKGLHQGDVRYEL